MGDSVLYVKALAMLVQEVRAQANPDALKALLTQARSFSRQRALQVEQQPEKLLVDGDVVDSSSGGLQALADAMRLHGVYRLLIAEGASPKELLQTAILLAKTPSTNPDDATVFDEARDLAFWYVRLVPLPRSGSGAEVTAGARELGALDLTVASTRSADLVQQVRAAVESNDTFRATALLRLIMDAERVTTSSDVKACWTNAFDSAATPATLEIVAGELPSAGDDHGAYLALLRRAGATGADALMKQLMGADKLETRRVYFDAILELRAGIPLLIDALNHPKWYVVRNAACLLGEMRATQAETALAKLLPHPDARVRVAASTALSQLDTPTARATLQQAIRDESPEVRRRALRGFSGEQGVNTSAAPLLDALEVERDAEVQVEILAAMGRVKTADAVQKLIRLCAPSAASVMSSSQRIAAAEALSSARGMAAIPFLRAMLEDRDPNVRTTARALISQVSGAPVGR